MNRLLALSLVLMAFTACNSISKLADPSGIQRPEDKPLGKEVNKPFDDMIANAAETETYLGAVHFDFDESKLKESTKQTLDRLARIINSRSGSVILEGHTDHVNTDDYNLRLGARRVVAVANYLISAGVWQERLYLRTHSEVRPAVSNWSAPGRAHNRRVVVRMFAQGPGATGPEALKIYKKLYPSE